MGAYARSKLAVMLWGLARPQTACGAVADRHAPHAPGMGGLNLSHVSDKPVMALAHRAVKAVADVFANDIEEGAAPTLYCISEPIPPGSYVGVDRWFGLRGGPVLIGRSRVACDYEAASRLFQFAENETGTTLPV